LAPTDGREVKLMGNRRGEQELLSSFMNLFKASGMEEEKVNKLFEGISGADLQNSPEIKRILEKDFEESRKREEERQLQAKREHERLELLRKLKKLEPQIENAEAELKKLSEVRDQILKSLKEE
jgi:hypothetical protein